MHKKLPIYVAAYRVRRKIIHSLGQTNFGAGFLDNGEGMCNQPSKPRAMRLSVLCLWKHYIYDEIFPKPPFGPRVPRLIGLEKIGSEIRPKEFVILQQLLLRYRYKIGTH